MIDALKRSLVAVKDLTEQPDSEFVLVAGSGGTRYYAVDDYASDGNIIEFYLGENIVFTCKVDGNWSLVNRAVVDVVTEEEVLRSSKDDHDAIEALHKELHPEEKSTVRDPGNYL